MKRGSAAAVLILLFVGIVPASHAQPIQGSPMVYAFSTHKGSEQTLFLQGNQSNMEMFRNWTIVVEGQGNYSVDENGTVLVKGYSASSVSIHEVFNASRVSVSVYFRGSLYRFDNITIVDFLSPSRIITVSVESYMPQQSQYLTVQSGQVHALMYQNWIAMMNTSAAENYSISVNGKIVDTGNVSGTKAVYFNVSRGGATVIIIVGTKSFDYPQEMIASVPLQQYYGHSAPAAQYTIAQYENFGIHVLAGSVIALLFSILIVGSWVISRKNRRVMQMR